MEELNIWYPGKLKKRVLPAAEPLRFPADRPEVNVTDLFCGIRRIRICHDVKYRMKNYSGGYDYPAYSDSEFIKTIRETDLNELGEIADIEVLLRMNRLCPEYLDKRQKRLLQIAAGVKHFFDYNDAEIILSDLQACDQMIDDRTEQETLSEDVRFRTMEQKRTIIRQLKPTELFFWKALPDSRYPTSYQLAFLHQIGDTEIEVWTEIRLFLTDMLGTVAADVSFCRR